MYETDNGSIVSNAYAFDTKLLAIFLTEDIPKFLIVVPATHTNK